jgi:hypothetical protein
VPKFARQVPGYALEAGDGGANIDLGEVHRGDWLLRFWMLDY